MRWGKIVLIFQAVVTVLIGIAFFSQLTIIGISDISDLREEMIGGRNFTEDIPDTITDIRNRYTVASYILLVVGLIELIIITRLLS